jgi:hypothetical protein
MCIVESCSGIPEGSMSARKLMVLFVAATATATLAFAPGPSEAQTTTVNQATAVKKKPAPTQVAVVGRPPAKVTVRKRSYLDPGTETKRGDEHYMDYANPSPASSHVPGPGDSRIDFMRMPFPTCFDLGSACR